MVKGGGYTYNTGNGERIPETMFPCLKWKGKGTIVEIREHIVMIPMEDRYLFILRQFDAI